MNYLTFGDNYSGIFQSQVIDVCTFIETELNTNVQLIMFCSLKLYFSERKKVKEKRPSAIILPMFPFLKNWKMNTYTLNILCWFLKTNKFITRGIFATNIALKLKEKGVIKSVCYDGRGAIKAEFEEYILINNKTLLKEIGKVEKNAILKSNYRIAVSGKLVEYWIQNYNFLPKNNYSIIPCTLTYSKFDKTTPNVMENFGYKKEDIILVYSGSTSGWQSLEALDRIIFNFLNENIDTHILFLAKIDLNSFSTYEKFPNRIKKAWLKPEEVHDVLSICDYGLLLRQYSVTNEVAAPTKFAEYLNAGLKVVISPKIGDYSDFVIKKECGVLYDENQNNVFSKNKEKEQMKFLAKKYFSKESFIPDYKKIISL